MGKKKKLNLAAIVVFCVLVLSLVMAIVGILIDWTITSVDSLVGGTSSGATLADWADLNGKTSNGIDGFGIMAAFAYITLALAALTTVVFVLSKFANIKILKWLLLILSALLAVSGIVAIATTFSFCSKYGVDAGIFVDAKVAPAAGAWLLSIFGIVGGASGVVGALKK